MISSIIPANGAGTTIPVDLNARIHEYIISGEFRRDMRRRQRATEEEKVWRTVSGRILRKCTHPGCNDFYLMHSKKRTTLCVKHALEKRYQRTNAAML